MPDLKAYKDFSNMVCVGDGEGVYGRDVLLVKCPDCKRRGDVIDDCELCHGAGVATGGVVKEVINKR